jgi:subfamily B ATP-binding cassette protein MsbA
MSRKKAGKKKLSFRQTIQQAWAPYRRLFGYVRPYKWRFILGLALGFLCGAVSGLLPLVLQKVTTSIFHGGAAPSATNLANKSELLNAGGSVRSIIGICLLIPAVMTVRSLLGYGNTYCMNWVSNRVVTDIRNQLFAKILNQSMAFFNRQRAGDLISRVTNNTMAMQAALTIVSSDAFKQPVSIIFAVGVLLYMDWKFTVTTLILFPCCIIPIQIFGKRARKAVQRQYAEMGQMVVTMQESFAGIRVIKSFTRERYQIKNFVRTTQQQFSHVMRMIKATEVTGPLVETLAAIGVGFALL